MKCAFSTIRAIPLLLLSITSALSQGNVLGLISRDNDRERELERRIDYPFDLRGSRKPSKHSPNRSPIPSRHLRQPSRLFEGQLLRDASFSSQLTPEWVTRYASGQAPSFDGLVAMAKDSSGNIFLTGSSSKLPFGTDFLTIKYNSNGDTIWSRRYEGGVGDDDPRDIAVDRFGNVYVTGSCAVSGTASEAVTVKYDPNGVLQCVLRFDASPYPVSWGGAIGIDSSGNAYVGVGVLSDAANRLYTRFLVKYGTSCSEIGRVTIGRPYGWNFVMSVSSKGNVYVISDSVRKYNSSLQHMWSGYYSANVAAAQVDANGDLVIFGNESNPLTNSSDYLTAKYNGVSGAKLWSRYYNSSGNTDDWATAIAIDASRNICVTGSSGSSWGTVKYSPTGDSLWSSTLNFSSEPNDIAFDANGSVILTGTVGDTCTTIKYNSSGTLQWQRQSAQGSYGLAVLIIGTDIFTSAQFFSFNSSYDFSLTKYNASGNQIWNRRFDGPGSSVEIARDMVVDALGNTYISGTTRIGGTSDIAYLTAKFNSSGVRQWVATYSDTVHRPLKLAGVATDRQGNVYVSGETFNRASNVDFTTIKYDGAGHPQWTALYTGVNNSYDSPAMVALDSTGNLFVAGSSWEPGTRESLVFVKYNGATGESLWVRRISVPWFSLYSALRDISVDRFGNLFVGTVQSRSVNSLDYLSIKYSGAGTELWRRWYNPGDTSYCETSSLIADNAGGVIITGHCNQTLVTLRYNSAGSLLWATPFPTLYTYSSLESSVAFDQTDFVYLLTQASFDSLLILKFAMTNGAVQWSRKEPVQTWVSERKNMVLNGRGSIFVTSTVGSEATSADWHIYEFDTSGTRRVSATYNSPENAYDIVEGVGVDAGGNAYLAGSTQGIAWSIFVVAKYSWIASSVENAESELPESYHMSEAYPNPFNPSTTIKYDVPKVTHVTIKIYNILGQEVYTLVDEQRNAGRFSAVWNGVNNFGNAIASGVYLIRMQVSDFTSVKKMMVVK